MSSNGYEKHKLKDAVHQRIYEADIKPEYSQGESVDKPQAVIVAGQPGAGKSTITKLSTSEFENRGGSVAIDIDELRTFHPKYKEFQSQNNREAASMVQRDASKWGNQLLNDSIKDRKNIVLDGTLGWPNSAENLTKQLRSAGYGVTVRAMAVRQQDSELSIHGRYEGLKAEGKPGRWVPLDIHKQAYTGMTQSIDRLNQKKLVDRIEVHGRSLDKNQSTRVLHNDRPGASDPVRSITEERNRPRTPEEAKAFKADTRLVAQHQKRVENPGKHPE